MVETDKFYSDGNFASDSELQTSFEQFVEEQSAEDVDNFLTNFMAFERVIEKAFNRNRDVIMTHLDRFIHSFGFDQTSQISRLKKEATDHSGKQKKIKADLKTLCKPHLF